ncbi:MAG: DUF1549 domain-containing protein [Planctomycetes bacterium]|nr:DUF1549 domain-containing protein [Planctomycetota bacterium]
MKWSLAVVLLAGALVTAAASSQSAPASTAAAPPAAALPAVALPVAAALTAEFDAALAAAWSAQGLVPAAPLDEARWLRRLSLDLRGTIPSPEEIERYFARPPATRRAEEIEAALADPRFAETLAFQWNDLLLAEAGKDAEKTARWLKPWLAERLAGPITFPQLARELVAAAGAARVPGAFAFPLSYRDSIETLAGVTARAFLGLQIQCAQCHDHPYDHWKQAEFNRFAAFFAELRGDHGVLSEVGGPGFRVLDRSPEWDLADRLADLERAAAKMGRDDGAMMAGGDRAAAANRRTPVEAAALAELRALAKERGPGVARPIAAFIADGEALAELRARLPGDARELLDRYVERREKFSEAGHLDGRPYADGAVGTRRQALVDWMTAAENPWFAAAQANRVVATLLGKGLTDPVDDLSGSSDRIVPALLERLAAALIEQGGDLRFLYRVVANSRAYALGAADDADPTEAARRERWLAAHPRRTFTPEQLAQSLLQLGVGEGASDAAIARTARPAGRAAPLGEQGDPRENALLAELARCSPRRSDVNDRTLEVNIPLALLLRHGEEAAAPERLKSEPLLARLFDPERAECDRVAPWFLATLSRAARPAEAAALLAALDPAKPRAAADDLFFALVNCAEFHVNP